MTLPFLSSALRRGVRIGLLALAVALPGTFAAQAQTCSDAPAPKVLVLPLTKQPDSPVSTDFLQSATNLLAAGMWAAQRGRIEVTTKEDFTAMLEAARLAQLLGEDSVGRNLVRTIGEAFGSVDWLVSGQVGTIGERRILDLRLVDGLHGTVVRSRQTTLPSTDLRTNPELFRAEGALLMQGVDCLLRSLRGRPVRPLVRLSVLPQPHRGLPGESLTVKAQLVDLAVGARPVPQKLLVFEYLTPQGVRSARTLYTDDTGIATDTLVLGEAHPRAGLIQARFVGERGAITRSLGINYYVVQPSGDLALATTNVQVSPGSTEPVSAVLRQGSTGMAGHAVSITTSGGSVSAASVTTNSAGTGSVNLTAPTTPSVVDLRGTVTLSTGGSRQASASVVVDPAVVMRLAAGGDTVILGASSLKVDLEREQRAVAGATVQFSVAGGGTLSAATASTDSVGRAEVFFGAPSRAGTSTLTASVTLDGQTYTRSVTLRYTDPLDAITREIADVKEALYLDPSDATLSRLDRLRSILQARGEGARYEAMLGDSVLVRNQLFCTHQRAHGDCAAGARSRGETTLGLLKSATSGSSVASEVFSRARDSLYRCPYPMFSDQQSVFSDTATINDIGGPPTYQFPIPVHFFLSLALDDDGSVKGMSWSATDPQNPRRFAYGFVPSTANGPTWTGRSTTINVEGLNGSYFTALLYQANASSSTASFTVDNTAASGFINLYEASVDNVPYTATVRFQANITLPAVPSPTMCNHASLPGPPGD